MTFYFSNGVLSEPMEGALKLAKSLNSGIDPDLQCDVQVSIADNQSYGAVADLCESALQLNLIGPTQDCLEAIETLRPVVGGRAGAFALWAELQTQVDVSTVVLEHALTLNGLLSEYRRALGESATARLVVVAHSQGNLFTNEVLTRLVQERGPSVLERFAIVSVATPASEVVGGGDPWPHTTIVGDLIAAVPNALPVNTPDYPVPGSCGLPWQCHSFIDTYLWPGFAKNRIVLKAAKASRLSVASLRGTEPSGLHVGPADQRIHLVGSFLNAGGTGRPVVIVVLPDRSIERLEGAQIETVSAGHVAVVIAMAAPGDYGFQFIDTDGRRSNVLIASVGVSPPPPSNLVPQAHFSATTGGSNATDGQTLRVVADPETGEARVTFTDASLDPDGSIASRMWMTDTPCVPGGTAPCLLSEGLSAFTWGFKPGRYTVTLAVRDNGGLTDSALVVVEVASAPETPRLFYDDGDAFTSFFSPVIDSQGRLYILRSLLDCGPGFCGMRLNSISQGGQLRWETARISASGLSSRRLLVGAGDRAHILNVNEIEAFEATGVAASGWPVTNLIPAPNTTAVFATDQPAVAGSDGVVFAKSGVFHSFGGFPDSVFALNPNGSLKWRADFPNGGPAFGLVRGPSGHVFTITDGASNPLSASLVALDQATGAEICRQSAVAYQGSFVGGPGGIFTSFRQDLTAYDGECRPTPLFTSSREELQLQAYVGDVIIGVDHVSTQADSGRLLGVRHDGTFLWRNEDIHPLGHAGSPIRTVHGDILYVLGRDLADGRQKIVLMNAESGQVVRTIPTDGLCASCGVAVAGDGTIYVNDMATIKIYRVPASVSVTETFYVDVFNVQGTQRLRLNGTVVATVTSGQSLRFDVGPALQLGANILEMEVEAGEPMWTYGYGFTADGREELRSVCGNPGVATCEANPGTTGVVYQQAYVIVKN